MPVRIYALAKELKIDSKELVDICTKAGIPGKGSALASLTDEEHTKLREFLANKSKPAERPAPARAPVAAAASTATVAKAGALTREDYIAPTGVGSKPPVLGPSRSDKPPIDTSRRKGPTPPDGQRPVQRSGPALKLAPMPAASSPPPKPAAREPAPQKPDLRLPADAIRAGKIGSKPLADHLRKHEQKRSAEGPKPTRTDAGSGGSGAAAPPAGAGAGVRDRAKRGRGVAAKAEDDMATMGGMREARQLNRKKGSGGARKRRGPDEEEGTTTSTPRRSTFRRQKRSGTNTAAPRKSKAVLEFPCSIRSFSEAIGVPAKQVLGKLLALGTLKTINAELDPEMAELLAVELGVELEIRRAVDIEQEFLASRDSDEDPGQLEPRPPVITVLGHVDHGKTSLLDKIIGIDVASGESGGITQHIRAYQIERKGRKISFVDTPGHEAFTEMRARGANVTDIAVLVVAADDGVMPQTEEAISHARAAEVPIVVALNKIDLPGVDVQRIYQQLATHELLPTEWGGDTELVKTSAMTGEGIEDLLETLLTIAELHDYRANPNRHAAGTCLEAALHEGRGVVAKMIVQKGTLRVGDTLVCGSAYGRVKAMYDTLDSRKLIEEAGPSMPVNVTGLDVAPAAGDHFYVADDIAEARGLAQRRQQQSRAMTLGGVTSHVTLENLFDRLGAEEVKTLNIILRADVRGSIEAIQKELTKLEHAEVKIRILQASVGGISEADVHLADASDAVIIGFNVVPDEGARTLADSRGVQIRRYEIIYKVTEDLKAALEGMLKPEQREAELGRALIQRTFTISRVGTIAGCRVLSGTIARNARMRVIRENRIIGDYPLDSLKREKDDAREVREGLECGIKLAGFNDLKEGDILEAYRIEEVARTF